jgi:hypothetical protein
MLGICWLRIFGACVHPVQEEAGAMPFWVEPHDSEADWWDDFGDLDIGIVIRCRALLRACD